MFCSYRYQICNDKTDCPAKKGGGDWKSFKERETTALGCTHAGDPVTPKEYQWGMIDRKGEKKRRG